MKINTKEVLSFSNKILTGMSIGIVVSLLPSALLGELAKVLGLDLVVEVTTLVSRLLAVVMGLSIAIQFNMTAIQSGTLALTTMIGSGAFVYDSGTFTLVGIGDVINAGLTAVIAVLVLQAIGDKLKAYTILVLPALVSTSVGIIGLMMLPTVQVITGSIGNMVATFTTLQPVLSSLLISMTFAFLIMSPISTVGVAMAISLSGIGSGAANLGVACAGFGLAIAGFKYNGFGTSVVHFLGSSKIQMANLMKKPIIIIPILVNAAITGAVGGLIGIQGTPFSAGFGVSGLVGPINHLNIVGYTTSNLLISTLVFICLPVLLGFVCYYVFIKKLNIVDEKDYYIEFK